MGTVTLHPWQVRCPDTEHPDELRIDLDPQPGTAFKEASAIAVDVLKPVLDELGLPAIRRPRAGAACTCSSGSSRTGTSSPSAARVSRWPARSSGARPDAVTTSWWKEERGERLFIDYNQNARDRTFASAYSARRTEIATVSTPLAWDDLAAADPDDYTIATVPGPGGQARRSVGRHRRRRTLHRTAAGDGRAPTRSGDWATCRTRRAIRRCRANRRACSRARKWLPTGTTTEGSASRPAALR